MAVAQSDIAGEIVKIADLDEAPSPIEGLVFDELEMVGIAVETAALFPAFAPEIIAGAVITGFVDIIFRIAEQKLAAEQALRGERLTFFSQLKHADDRIWDLLGSSCEMPRQMLHHAWGELRGSLNSALSFAKPALDFLKKALDDIPKDDHYYINQAYLSDAVSRFPQVRAAVENLQKCFSDGDPCRKRYISKQLGTFQNETCLAEYAIMKTMVTEFPPDHTLRLEKAPNLCMDVQYGDYRVGADVIMWHCHGNENQQWIMQEGSIRPKYSRTLCLDSQIPEKLVLQKCQLRRKRYQQFQINIATSKMRSTNTSQCVHAVGGSTRKRPLKLADCVEDPAAGPADWYSQAFTVRLPMTPPRQCTSSVQLLKFLDTNSQSNTLVDLRKSNLRFSEEERRAVDKDVNSCKLAARIHSNRTVKDETTAIQLVALVTEEDEMQRLAHSLRAMVQGVCLSKPPASSTWYGYQTLHIQPHVDQLIRKASIADAEAFWDLEDNAMKLASDMDSGSEAAALEGACLATLNLMQARKGTIPRNLACTDVQNKSSCKTILALFEEPMTGKPLPSPYPNMAGTFSSSEVSLVIVALLFSLVLLGLRKRIWVFLKAVLKKIVNKVPSEESQYEVAQDEPLVSIEEGAEATSARLAPTRR